MTRVIQLYLTLQLLLGAPLDALVSKGQGLPHWYAPGESAAARKAMEEMALAAEDAGVLMFINSGYRDFHYQLEVLERLDLNSSGSYRSFSADAGHSEHQLGTTFDVAWPGLPVESLDLRNLKLFAWLESNAHRFGFVISYPYKESPDWPFHNRWLPLVTEYIYEPWHIRFVGLELAGEIHQAGYLNPESSVLPQDYYAVWP